MNETKSGAPGPIIIKKYANRRLYNTHTSSYVTLDHLCEMVKEGVEFEVRDARTGPGRLGKLISDDAVYNKVTEIEEPARVISHLVGV